MVEHDRRIASAASAEASTTCSQLSSTIVMSRSFKSSMTESSTDRPGLHARRGRSRYFCAQHARMRLRAQLHQPDAVCRDRRAIGSDLEREAGLSDATGTRESHERRSGFAESPTYLGNLRDPANEMRRRAREIVLDARPLDANQRAECDLEVRAQI